MGIKHKTRGSSCPSDALRSMWKSHSVQNLKPSPSIAPSLYKSFAIRQRNIKDLFKGGSIKEMMR